LHDYLARKTAEVRAVEAELRGLNLFNHRQAELIRHALKHPLQEYTIASHRRSHEVVYQTARTDLLDLQSRGCLELRRLGKRMIFSAVPDLAGRIRRMDAESGQPKG
jgi:Fic family protein